jgi:hypothetical protein
MSLIKSSRTWFRLRRTQAAAFVPKLAAMLGGRLEIPKLPWKYLWIQKLFGFTAAKRVCHHWNQYKSSVIRSWDKTLFRLGGGNMAVTPASLGTNSAV